MSRRMKDSGVEWVGEMPEDWMLSKIKNLTSVRSEISKYMLNNRFVALENVESGTGRFVTGISTGYEGEYPEFKDGDLLFSKLRPYLRKAILPNFEGHCSGEFIVFDDFDGEMKFLFYYIMSDGFIDDINSSTYGAKMPRANWEAVGGHLMPVPSYGEQTEIISYLDQKTASIDHIIEKTKESIEDYKLYKQSLISEAVTKGLDPNVKFKDSGVEWIGKIPEHWGIQKLKHIGDTKSGLGNKTLKDFGHGYPFISYKNVYDNLFISDKYPDKVQSTENERMLFNVLRGDAFFTGSSETVEELGMSSMCLQDIPNATFNGFCIRLRPYGFATYHPEFYMYYFRSNATREHLVRNDNSVTRANLSQRLLRMLPVVIPPLNEQIEIAKYLDRSCHKLDKIIIQKEQLIEDLEAYKKSLIYEVVTGKREVG